MDKKIGYGIAAIILILFSIVVIAAIQFLSAIWQLHLDEAPYNLSVTDDYCVRIGYEYVRNSMNAMECCKTMSYADTILGKLPLKTVCSDFIYKDGWQ